MDWLPPSGITDRLLEDPIVALECPRADFDAAVLEFLIGLFSAALAPADEARWEDARRYPPSPAMLRAKLASLPDAFALDGDGARAYQDRDLLEDVEATPIESLLIGAAGDQAIDHNTDLFAKRNRVGVLGRPAAAMAVLTMQTYAPAGGQGHRTSMRGGGPLTTLVDPRAQPRVEPLWSLIWANAETQEQIDARDGDTSMAWEPADRFPWLAQTRTSNPKQHGRPTHAEDAAPDQVYFGLPRRIRLDIVDVDCVCVLTGKADNAQVSSFRMKNYGVQYVGWTHPLTPYYLKKPAGGQDGEATGLLPVHGQPGGLAWRDWLGLLLDRPDQGGSRPSQAVGHYRVNRATSPFRLRVSGYDMDKMKARAWVQAELPALPDSAMQRVLAFAEAATMAAQETVSALLLAIKAALLQRPSDAPGDYQHWEHELWANTQRVFFEFVGKFTEQRNIDGPVLRQCFRQALRDAALSLFDRACPIDAGLETSHMRRPIAARHALIMTLEGYGKAGAAFFKALNLAPPEPSKSKSKKRKAA